MNVITIDGPSGSGKSTIARGVAAKLDISYVNSGLIYRAITYLVVKENESKIEDLAFISAIINKNEIVYDNERIYINGVDVTRDAKNEALTTYLPKITAIDFVRNHVNKLMHSLTKTTDIIIDGRDIGTVVFPNATLKIYLDADVEVRAKRRFDEVAGQGFSYEDILEGLKKRDYADMNREIAPLKKASDAIVIDSTNLTIVENIEKVIELYDEVK